MHWDLTVRDGGDQFDVRNLSYAQVNVLLRTYERTDMEVEAKLYGDPREAPIERRTVNIGEDE